MKETCPTSLLDMVPTRVQTHSVVLCRCSLQHRMDMTWVQGSWIMQQRDIRSVATFISTAVKLVQDVT